ncbi:MAG TPA: carbohydrate kinase family protein [Bacillota bacterium]
MKSNTNPWDLDIYLYGMTVLSTIHRLAGPYPEADSYQEIKETYRLPGGETGNSAIILSNLGYKVKIDGPFLGEKTKFDIEDFCAKHEIDCSGMLYDPGFDGVQDLVLIDGHTRTVFGKFAQYFGDGKRWSQPDRSAIGSAKIVSLDPFFGAESEMTADYCAALGKKYVTIDCAPESKIHKNAAATVISNEYIKNNFPDEELQHLMKRYTAASDGLVIFTFGAREILYCRKGDAMKSMVPFRVEVKSTLGAGDTFRAGVVYGVLNQMSDEQIVKFAAATAASVCMRFPMALDPPSLDEITDLAERG